ncbi:hypothetical protein LSH36_623g03014 [Paralvinella palmiformis]|uniref:Uncharacterized protein n=1 Tax=Paralvinella palmiformis TaxID=53620 RepID=A0AAD9J5X1_9ANNE|nr:hypothetical protein LSH36_623g03014 [Paralvinella palmiformis]
MKVLLLAAALLGLACAGEYITKEKGYAAKNEVNVEYHAGYEEFGYKKQLIYHGRYPGKCGNDGFYYNDKYTFVICSNGNSYTQNCAPGSENSGFSHFEYGKQYYYHDFCDVNLVDEGYAADHAGHYGPFDGYHGANHLDHGYGGYDGNLGYGNGLGYGGADYGHHAFHEHHEHDHFDNDPYFHRR